MVSVESYRIFLCVADCASFSGAAKRLRLTLTKVSRSVAELEEELGVTLLKRTTRHVALTAQGLAFAEQIWPAIDLLDAAAGSLRGAVSPQEFNVLRVACGRAEGEAMIAPAFAGFLAQHREASMTLDMIERPVAVDNEGYDLAFRLVEGPAQPQALAQLDLALVASPIYCAAHNRPYAADDVAQHKLLVWAGMRQWAFRGSAPFTPTAHILSNDINFIKECCIAAYGIALLPMALVRDEIAAQALIQLLDGFEPRPLQLLADWGSKPLPVKGAQLFLDHLKGYCRQQRL